MAITYGEAAAVPEPLAVSERILTKVGLLSAMTMPQHRALPMKKTPNLQYTILNVLLMWCECA